MSFPFPFTALSIDCSVSTAPLDADILIDVNKNGTSIFLTRITVNDGEKTGDSAIDPTKKNYAIGDILSVDIDQVGTTAKGKGLKLIVTGIRP